MGYQVPYISSDDGCLNRRCYRALHFPAWMISISFKTLSVQATTEAMRPGPSDGKRQHSFLIMFSLSHPEFKCHHVVTVSWHVTTLPFPLCHSKEGVPVKDTHPSGKMCHEVSVFRSANSG